MKRPVFVCLPLLVWAAALAGQTAPPNPYSGTSNPPPDTGIIDNLPPLPAPPQAKPSPSKPVASQPSPAQLSPSPMQSMAPAVQPQGALPPTPANPADGTDDGIVQVAPSAPPPQPALNERAEAADPDGDIVHPAPLPPGELAPGTEIRVRLLDRLSSANNQSGDAFRCRVASDVYRDNEVLIPAGAEIDGTVVETSTGHFAGHGSMLLRPDTVILPDGAHYRLYAMTTGTPGSNARVRGEGTITPGSQLRKDGIEYGGAVGAGFIVGGIAGGPPGMLAGTLIGAGAVTTHLLVSHPQATLEPGAVLLFSLTEPLNLVMANPGTAQPTAGAQPDQAAPEGQPSADAPPAPASDAQPGQVSQN
jgi:hypothetical protein